MAWSVTPNLGLVWMVLRNVNSVGVNREQVSKLRYEKFIGYLRSGWINQNVIPNPVTTACICCLYKDVSVAWAMQSKLDTHLEAVSQPIQSPPYHTHLHRNPHV